jgi:hypothetical protein
MVTLLRWLLVGFNMVGGLMAAAWLMARGQWPELLIGLGAIVLAPLILPLLLLPVDWLAPKSSEVAAAERLAPMIVQLGAATFLLGMVMAWWMTAAPGMVLQVTPAPVSLPVLVWAYNVAALPWALLARRQPTAAARAWAGYAYLTALAAGVTFYLTQTVTPAIIVLCAVIFVCWAADVAVMWQAASTDRATRRFYGVLADALERQRQPHPGVQPDEAVRP